MALRDFTAALHRRCFAAVRTDAAPRSSQLDLAKGIGIVLVAVAHTGLLPKVIAPWIYEFYMPLFLVITGRLYAQSGTFGLGTAKKRLGSVAKNYFTAALLLFALWFVLFGLRDGALALAGPALFSIVYGRFWDPANPLLTDVAWSGQLWYFTLLFTATVLYSLLRPLDNGKPLRRLLLAAALIAAGQLLRLSPVLLPWCLDTAPLGALLLLLPPWLDDATARLPRPLRALGEAALFVALHDTYDLHQRCYGRLPGVLGVVAIVSAGYCGSDLLLLACKAWSRFAKCGPVRRYLLWVGRNSSAVFCGHVFLLFALGLVLDRLVGFAPIRWPLLLAGLLVCLPLCILLPALVCPPPPRAPYEFETAPTQPEKRGTP